jgi:hypothetical protein
MSGALKIPISTDALQKGSARMTEKLERPDWVQQIEPVLETVNEGVLIADDCRRVVFVNAGFVARQAANSEMSSPKIPVRERRQCRE